VTSAPLLVIEHEAQCPPGWMAEWLLDAGALLDVRRPYRGDALPDSLAGHGGMLVLGGEMGAGDDDRYPWLSPVKGLIVQAATTERPALGICLGHQLAAVALGGEVQPNPLGQQIGVLGVGWTEAAACDRVFASLAARGTSAADVPAVQWNNDVVLRLPEGAVDLAHTSGGELQAARFAPTVWGVQWHPEAGEEIIRPWADHDRDEAFERGVDVYAYLGDVIAARERLRATSRELADRFAEVCGVGRVAEARR
jgi:GMP synthase (glutamine-hydrolysing)